jgi:hypothetical protein
MGMHVLAGTDELYHEEPCLWFRKDTTTMEHAHKRAVRAELQSHIDTLFFLKAVDKTNDVGMIQRFVDLYLCVELNPCSALNNQ